MKEKANRRRVEEIALMDVDALLVNCGGVDPADAALGRIKSDKKAASSRENGKKG